MRIQNQINLLHVFFILPLIYITMYPESVKEWDEELRLKFANIILGIGLTYHLYVFIEANYR
jgi:hypothetical protein